MTSRTFTAPRQRCPSRRRRYRQGTANRISKISHRFLASEPAHKSRGIKLLRRTLRIPLLRTRQICWMSAADWETPSRELPKRTSSSFWALEISTSTPGCITTRRTIFSPMKLLHKRSSQHLCSISAHAPPFIPIPPRVGLVSNHTGSQPRSCQSRRSSQR